MDAEKALKYIKEGKDDGEVEKLIRDSFSDNLEKLKGLEILPVYLDVRGEVDLSKKEEIERALTILGIPAIMEYRKVGYQKEKGKLEAFRGGKVLLKQINYDYFFDPYDKEWKKFWNDECEIGGKTFYKYSYESMNEFLERIGIDKVDGKSQWELRWEENKRLREKAEKEVKEKFQEAEIENQLKRLESVLDIIYEKGSSDNLHILEYFGGLSLSALKELMECFALKSSTSEIEKWEIETQEKIIDDYCQDLKWWGKYPESLDAEKLQLNMINSTLSLLESYKLFLIGKEKELKIEGYLKDISEGIQSLQKTIEEESRKIRWSMMLLADSIYASSLIITRHIRAVGRVVESFRIGGIGFGIGIMYGSPKISYGDALRKLSKY